LFKLYNAQVWILINKISLTRAYFSRNSNLSTKNFSIVSRIAILLGFWRGVGYFISVLIIIGGILFLPYGIVAIILGIIFIWMLRRGASQARMEKTLKEIRDIDRERSLREIADRDKTDLDKK